MDQALIVFVMVAEKRNFTRAAEALHMTQPAVSQHIRLLEEKLGTALLERNNKKVEMNKAGMIVYRHAKEILHQYGQMQRLLDELMGKAGGDLAIGASYTFGEYCLPHIIAKLKKRYPLIKPKITIANSKRIGRWVQERELDIGIVDGSESEHGTAEAFAEDLMVVVAAADHPLAKKRDLSWQALADEVWILREESSGTREITAKLFAEQDFQPRSLLEFGSTQVIKESVQAGIGISLLSRYTIVKELAGGDVVILDVAGTPFIRKFAFRTPLSDFRTKATDVFITLLRETAIQQTKKTSNPITVGYDA